MAGLLVSHHLPVIRASGNGTVVSTIGGCDAIHYKHVTQELARIDGFCDEVMKPVSVNWPKIDLSTLRPEQSLLSYGFSLTCVNPNFFIKYVGTKKINALFHSNEFSNQLMSI